MTTKQRDFVAKLAHQNNITAPMLDWYARTHFGIDARGSVDDLNVRQASQLIDQMKLWKGAPDDVRRAFGQLGLPGVNV